MTMITHDQIGTDEDLAREILIVAKDIAPCIASFANDSEEAKNTVAILRRVYKDIAGRGNRLMRAQRMGPASVDYSTTESAFEGQPSRALRALCTSAKKPQGGSRASFPSERPVAKLWPESY